VVTGTEHILLVDDEKVVRELATTMLVKRGFKVTEARTGEEAVSLYSSALAETSGGTFDGVILDLGMPGMGGMRCLEELKKLNPKVKVLVASGYTSTLQINQVMDAGAKGFIAKPYKLTMLINQVREMLDG
jgi:CheY-like chemotaxis protein